MLLFALAVCAVCSVLVAGAAVALAERQKANQVLDRQKKILAVAGLMPEGAEWTAAKVGEVFSANIVPQVIELSTGLPVPGADALAFDQRAEARDPRASDKAPPNQAGIARLPRRALVYRQLEGGNHRNVILQVEGKGLWSTMHGFVALTPDLTRIEGLTFYEHGETPGLGAEVENPKWQALWKGRRPFDAEGRPVIEVIKGTAGPATTDPTRVDGLSGATITGRGVTHLLRFWLSERGYGPYLARLRAEGETP